MSVNDLACLSSYGQHLHLTHSIISLSSPASYVFIFPFRFKSLAICRLHATVNKIPRKKTPISLTSSFLVINNYSKMDQETYNQGFPFGNSDHISYHTLVLSPTPLSHVFTPTLVLVCNGPTPHIQTCTKDRRRL